MASTNRDEVVLMSIHPVYAQKILNGSKTIEFRKTAFQKKVKYIILYATAPQKQIVGYFEVVRLESNTPKQIWKKYSTKGGIEQELFNKYFGSSKKAIAIIIGKVVKLRRPLKLETICTTNPPQNFYYLNDTNAWRIINNNQ